MLWWRLFKKKKTIIKIQIRKEKTQSTWESSSWKRYFFTCNETRLSIYIIFNLSLTFKCIKLRKNKKFLTIFHQ